MLAEEVANAATLVHLKMILIMVFPIISRIMIRTYTILSKIVMTALRLDAALNNKETN